MSDHPEKHTSQLERAEHYIYLAAGYILVLAAAGLLLAALIEMGGRIGTAGADHLPACLGNVSVE